MPQRSGSDPDVGTATVVGEDCAVAQIEIQKAARTSTWPRPRRELVVFLLGHGEAFVEFGGYANGGTEVVGQGCQREMHGIGSHFRTEHPEARSGRWSQQLQGEPASRPTRITTAMTKPQLSAAQKSLGRGTDRATRQLILAP